ncbi:class I SAM-dependent methyltransferase [soil metagenome]
MGQPRRDFASAPVRGRLEAWGLRVAATADHALVGDRKQAVIGAMSGTVVELGPGPGVNMRYYAPGTRVIAVEPNPAMHRGLRAAAMTHGQEVDVRMVHGEDLDLADSSVDGVVGTLVLCGVDDPAAVLATVRRVLRPGGTYFFYEHVAGAPGSGTRLAQRVAKRPQRWLLNGCEVDRDTGSLLAGAGFAEVAVESVDAGLQAVWTRTRIIGTARV